MFNDTKFVEEFIQVAEKQRKVVVQAWEQYVDHCQDAYDKFGKMFDLKPNKK